MIESRPSARTHLLHWSALFFEAAIVITSIIYLVNGNLWALVTWEGVTISYLIGGLTLSWSGKRNLTSNRAEIRAATKWSWILPVIASLTGVNSAIVALAARNDTSHQDTFLLAIAASLGVVLSWTLLQVGFAEVYQLLANSEDGTAIYFPKTPKPAMIEFLYFSFTIGTAFATSDAQVNSLRIRRIVMLHSILSFFYNALVVAIAFQVLREIIGG